MSSNFYMKAQTLHEEFQSKELLYLNAERKLNDSLMRKRDLDVPLQEYLKKIHEREMKNEETYLSIMKQMSELDQHTDLLCSKIEKLGIFRNIHVGHSLNDTNYPFTSKFIQQTQNALQNFNTEPIVSQFEINNLKPSTSNASNQTENIIYCDNCRSEMQISYQASLVKNSTSSTIDNLSVNKNKPQVISSSRLRNDSFSNKGDNDLQFTTSSLKTEHSPQQIYNSTSSAIDILTVNKNEHEIIDSLTLQNGSFSSRNDDNSQFITSSLNTEHFLPQMYENKKYIERNSKGVLQANENYEAKSSSSSTPKKSKSTKEVLEEKQTTLQPEEVLLAENAVKNSQSNQIFTESKSNDSEINVDVSVSKSDRDSVNHEFDFLESDTVHLSSKLKLQNSSKNNTASLSDVDKNRDQANFLQAANSDGTLSKKSSVKLKYERGHFQLNKKQETNDNRSETSESISETHSPAIYLSDSDSVDEKGSFTASAAYKSLLENTIIPSKIKKQVSESESEDEVEKTLASTVQKSNIKSRSSVQPKNDKSFPQSVDSKLSNKPKPVSINKPQSKLSKSTKMVLGIDTSSGSELEAAVKSPESKNDDDSDEFNFFN